VALIGLWLSRSETKQIHQNILW